MKERIVNKLVRDYIPDIIQEQGQTPVFRTLDDQEYAQCLEQKLREEVGEFLQEKNLDELGDILEVLEELAHLQGWTDGEIRHTRRKRPRPPACSGSGCSWKRSSRSEAHGSPGAHPPKAAAAIKEEMEHTSLDKITVTQIVERAGVTRQTFYRNFKDKYDLVNWHFEQLAQKSFKQMGAGLTLREASSKSSSSSKGSAPSSPRPSALRTATLWWPMTTSASWSFTPASSSGSWGWKSCPRTLPFCCGCTARAPST